MPDMQGIKQETDRCFRCGLCLGVCPTYGATNNEAQVARGRLFLTRNVLEGNIELTKDLADIINQCLLCHACMNVCPAAIELDDVLINIRSEWKKKYPDTKLKRLILNVISHKDMFNFLLKIYGGYFQKICASSTADQDYTIPRILLKRAVFKVPPKAFRDSFPEVRRVDNAKGRVAFFTGCMANAIHPFHAKATVEVLNRKKLEVVVPKEQNCCGLAHYINGQIDTAKRLALNNLKALSKAGVKDVVATCPSCCSMLSEYYPKLLGEELPFRVWDAHEYILENSQPENVKMQLDMELTYHDPCHFSYILKKENAPRKLLLENISGIEIKEMNAPKACCGAGGLSGFVNYEKSLPITDKKIKDIEETGCNWVATTCTACMLQITDGILRHELDAKVVYPMEILAAAYKSQAISKAIAERYVKEG